MYLFVWKTGQSRVVMNNLTVTDMLAVSSGSVQIYKYDEIKKKFYHLIFDENKVNWIPVKDARELKTEEARLHHP